MLSKEEIRTAPLPIYKPKAGTSWLKMLVYGSPGVGKTTLLASAQAVPAMSPMLMFNIEGGMMAITDPEVYKSADVPDTIDFENFEDVVKVFDFLRKGHHPYKSIGIDSISELAKFNLDWVIANKNNKKDEQVADEDNIFLEDYGTMTKKMRRVIRLFRDLPMHVLMTCHDAPADKLGVKIGPSLTPSLRTSVVGFVDVCAYMFTKEVPGQKEGEEAELKRFILTSAHPKFIAKDRSPGQKLGGIVENPTMPGIYKLLTAGTPTSNKGK